MLKSSNLNSVMSELPAEEAPVTDRSQKLESRDKSRIAKSAANMTTSLAAVQLSAGVLNIVETPLEDTLKILKELIGKQNKAYIDVSKEKCKLDCTELSQLSDMMNNVKLYKEKLARLKKEMQSIYQRSKVLKKRATNVANCKHREFQRKLEKQRQEESLIANQTQ